MGVFQIRNYKITVNGNIYNVSVEDGGAGNAVPYQGPYMQQPQFVQQQHVGQQPQFVQQQPVSVMPVQVQQPIPVAVPTAQGATTIEAPMPGTLLAYRVAIGDKVSKHQVLAILEAMKMENEIVSPVDGVISSLNQTPGSSVNSGDIILTIA